MYSYGKGGKWVAENLDWQQLAIMLWHIKNYDKNPKNKKYHEIEIQESDSPFLFSIPGVAYGSLSCVG